MNRRVVFLAGVVVGVGLRRFLRVCIEVYAEEAPQHSWMP